MLKQDKQFVFAFFIAAMLISALVIENINQKPEPYTFRKTIDVAAVKAKIEQAGLTPHAARHWVTVENLEKQK